MDKLALILPHGVKMITKILIIISAIVYLLISFKILQNASCLYRGKNKLKLFIIYYLFPFCLWYHVLINIMQSIFAFNIHIYRIISALIAIWFLGIFFCGLGGILFALGVNNIIIYYGIIAFIWWLAPLLLSACMLRNYINRRGADRVKCR